MKRNYLLRSVAVSLLLTTLLALTPSAAFAANLSGSFSSSSSFSTTSGSIINTSFAGLGYITVNYDDGSGASSRVGISFNNGPWSYFGYSMGYVKEYSLNGGSGAYAITLLKKVGSNYVLVSQASFTAAIGGTAPQTFAAAASSEYSKYLSSTPEISFSQNDSVARKASSLCKGKKTDQEKILAIYNYIAKNFKYDRAFANDVISGRITTYIPKPASILSNKKGVCYDFASLFAAMCRTQGIPCKLVKGFSTKASGYHAWNSVYDSASDRWYTIDLTMAISKRNRTASKFSKCCMADKYYTANSSV